jgi:hypothetical protein
VDKPRDRRCRCGRSTIAAGPKFPLPQPPRTRHKAGRRSLQLTRSLSLPPPLRANSPLPPLPRPLPSPTTAEPVRAPAAKIGAIEVPAANYSCLRSCSPNGEKRGSGEEIPILRLWQEFGGSETSRTSRDRGKIPVDVMRNGRAPARERVG